MGSLETCANLVFERLWKNYTDLVVDARTIETALRSKGDTWNEDHIAFRTLPGEFTGKHVLTEVFEALGYKQRDKYHFEDKKLDALWLEPPETSGKRSEEVPPKVFISELIIDGFSAPFQKLIHEAVSQVKTNPVEVIKALSAKVVAGDSDAADKLVDECVSFLSGGAIWSRPSLADYEILRKESEYAAWTLLFGFNVNHFTVSAHLMRGFNDIHGLNSFIQKDLRIPMNTTGGVTKGNPELLLEQSSTLAIQIPVRFQDGIRKVPYAFVEFAYRWPLGGQTGDGKWHSYYQGFVSDNADKIFESTNVR